MQGPCSCRGDLPTGLPSGSGEAIRPAGRTLRAVGVRRTPVAAGPRIEESDGPWRDGGKPSCTVTACGGRARPRCPRSAGALRARWRGVPPRRRRTRGHGPPAAGSMSRPDPSSRIRCRRARTFGDPSGPGLVRSPTRLPRCTGRRMRSGIRCGWSSTPAQGVRSSRGEDRAAYGEPSGVDGVEFTIAGPPAIDEPCGGWCLAKPPSTCRWPVFASHPGPKPASSTSPSSTPTRRLPNWSPTSWSRAISSSRRVSPRNARAGDESSWKSNSCRPEAQWYHEQLLLQRRTRDTEVLLQPVLHADHVDRVGEGAVQHVEAISDDLHALRRGDVEGG